MTNHQTTYQPVETNHLLHLVLSLVTCGFWLPVWALVAIVNMNRTRRLTTVGSYSPYVGQYRPQAVYPPYAVGPGAPVGPMNPAPPGPPGVPRVIGSTVAYPLPSGPSPIDLNTGRLRPMGVPAFVPAPTAPADGPTARRTDVCLCDNPDFNCKLHLPPSTPQDGTWSGS